jgi:cell division septum initiation protein DivIVA
MRAGILTGVFRPNDHELENRNTLLRKEPAMRINSRLPLLTGVLLALTVPGSPARAGAPATPPPLAPATMEKLPSAWEFTVEPYFWASSIDGTIGLGGYSTGFDVGFDKIIKHFDIGAALTFDLRHDRWSFFFDGSYVKLSGASDTPGPLYKGANMDFKQAYLQGAVAYRVLEGKRGWLEVFGGVRWNYMGVDLNLTQDSQGIEDFSQEVSNRAVNRTTAAVQKRLDEIAAALEPVVKSKLSQTAADVKSGIISNAKDRILGAFEGLPDRPGHGLPGRFPPGFGAEIVGKANAYADALVAQKVAEAQAALDAAKANAVKKAQQAVARAKNQLASAISQELRQRLPTSASRSVDWLDPIVGLRARLNLSDQFFLKLYGDIGGFGAGSELAWQYYAGLCWQVSTNGALEAGWRQNYNDYSNGSFLYRASMYGPYLAYSYRF